MDRGKVGGEDERAKADQRRGGAHEPAGGEEGEGEHRRRLGERDQRQRPEDARVADMTGGRRGGDAGGAEDAGNGNGEAREPVGGGRHGTTVWRAAAVRASGAGRRCCPALRFSAS